jgi:hypothetical protein
LRDKVNVDVTHVILAEVGNGLEVRCQAPREPHQLDVALGLALQPSARLDPIQIAVDVDLQQDRRVIRGSSSSSGLCTFEAQFVQPQFIDEDVDDPNRIVLGER